MVVAALAWIEGMNMKGDKECLANQDISNGRQQDVHMTDVSASETVGDVEEGILSTLSQISDEMESVSTEDVIRTLFQLRTMYHAVLSGDNVLVNVCKRAIENGDNSIINNAGINDVADL